MKKQNFLQGSLVLLASAGIAKVIGAIFRIPLANMLGGVGMGYFSSAYGIFMTIYAVTVSGLPIAVAKFTSENLALGRISKLHKTRKISLAIFSLIGLVFTIFIGAFAYPFCEFVGKNPEAYFAVIAIAPSVFLGCVVAVYRGYYEGLRNMNLTAFSQVIEAIFKLVFGLFLCKSVFIASENNSEIIVKIADFMRHLSFGAGKNLLMSYDDFVLPIASAAAIFGVTISSFSSLLFVMIYTFFNKKSIGKTAIKSEISSEKSLNRNIVKDLFSVVIAVALGALVTNLTSLIDLVTINFSLGEAIEKSPEMFQKFISEEVTKEDLPNFFFGSFIGLAVTVFNLIPSFTNMFGKGIIPEISKFYAISDEENVKKSVKNVIFTTGFIAIPAGIGISVLAPKILDLLFRTRQMEVMSVTNSLKILGVGVIFLSLASVLFSVLQALGKGKIVVKIMFVGVILKLILNLALVRIPKININGAAISTTFCYILIFILIVFETVKVTKVDFWEIFSLLLRMSIGGALCSYVAFLSENILVNYWDSRFTLIFSVAIGIIFYVISLHLLGIITKSSIKLLIS